MFIYRVFEGDGNAIESDTEFLFNEIQDVLKYLKKFKVKYPKAHFKTNHLNRQQLTDALLTADEAFAQLVKFDLYYVELRKGKERLKWFNITRVPLVDYSSSVENENGEEQEQTEQSVEES